MSDTTKTATQRLEATIALLQEGFADAQKHEAGNKAAGTRLRNLARDGQAQLKDLYHAVQAEKVAK